MWHTLHASPPVHTLPPLSKAPLPIFSPSCTFLLKVPSALPHLQWRPPLHSTLYTSIASPTYWAIWQSWRWELVYFLYPYFWPTRIVPTMAPTPLSLTVSKYLCCLQCRHTAAGIYPKPGVSEIIAGLGHKPNWNLPHCSPWLLMPRCQDPDMPAHVAWVSHTPERHQATIPAPQKLAKWKGSIAAEIFIRVFLLINQKNNGSNIPCAWQPVKSFHI